MAGVREAINHVVQLLPGPEFGQALVGGGAPHQRTVLLERGHRHDAGFHGGLCLGVGHGPEMRCFLIENKVGPAVWCKVGCEEDEKWEMG